MHHSDISKCEFHKLTVVYYNSEKAFQSFIIIYDAKIDSIIIVDRLGLISISFKFTGSIPIISNHLILMY